VTIFFCLSFSSSSPKFKKRNHSQSRLRVVALPGRCRQGVIVAVEAREIAVFLLLLEVRKKKSLRFRAPLVFSKAKRNQIVIFLFLNAPPSFSVFLSSCSYRDRCL